MKRKAQLTVFVIVTILLIAMVALFFLFRLDIIPRSGGKAEEDPNKFFASCIEEKLKDTIQIIGAQGGYIENPLHIDFRFSDEKVATNISYLCYTQNYYFSCVNQEPLLIQHLKKEIKQEIDSTAQDCFDDLTNSLEKEGYIVDARFSGFDVLLNKGKVIIETESKLTLTKSGETSSQANIKVVYPTKFYDLALVAQEINSQEARFCNFEHLGYMILYPKYDIDKFRTGDSTTIYTIKHRDSKEMFRFAVRSCAIPSGF